MRGYKHERLHQCIRCTEFDEKDSYCIAGGKHITEPKRLIYCMGFNPRARVLEDEEVDESAA